VRYGAAGFGTLKAILGACQTTESVKNASDIAEYVLTNYRHPAVVKYLAVDGPQPCLLTRCWGVQDGLGQHCWQTERPIVVSAPVSNHRASIRHMGAKRQFPTNIQGAET